MTKEERKKLEEQYNIAQKDYYEMEVGKNNLREIFLMKDKLDMLRDWSWSWNWYWNWSWYWNWNWIKILSKKNILQMKKELIEKILEKYLLWDVESPTSPTPETSIFEWKYVIVRCYDAWIRCWKLIDWTVWNIIMEDARNLWRRWCKKSIGLSWLASYWLADKEEVMVLATQKRILITDKRVSTFFEVSTEIEKQMREWETTKQSRP